MELGIDTSQGDLQAITFHNGLNTFGDIDKVSHPVELAKLMAKNV